MTDNKIADSDFFWKMISFEKTVYKIKVLIWKLVCSYSSQMVANEYII